MSWLLADCSWLRWNVILFCQQSWSIDLIDDYSKKLRLFRALIICRGMNSIHLSSAPSITTNFRRITFSIYKTKLVFFSLILQNYDLKEIGNIFDHRPPARRMSNIHNSFVQNNFIINLKNFIKKYDFQSKPMTKVHPASWMLFIRFQLQLSAIYRESITLCDFHDLISESLISKRNLDIFRKLDFTQKGWRLKCSAQFIYQT